MDTKKSLLAIAAFGIVLVPVTLARTVTLSATPSTTPGVTYNVYRSTSPGSCSKTAVPIATGLKTPIYQDTKAGGWGKRYYSMAAITSTGHGACDTTEQMCQLHIKKCTPHQTGIVTW
jgi:hypothetical protein